LFGLSALLKAWDGYDSMNHSYITLKSTFTSDGNSYIRIYDHSDYRMKDLLVTSIKRGGSFYVINVYDSLADEKRVFEMQMPEGKGDMMPNSEDIIKEGKITFGELLDSINVFKHFNLF